MSNGNGILKQSVKRGDVQDTPYGGATIVNLFAYGQQLVAAQIALPQRLPPYWSAQRDAVLLSTFPDSDPLWADAVSIFVTQQTTRRWEVRAGRNVQARVQEMLVNLGAEQEGFHTELAKVALDYALTDNGVFLEVIRRTSAASSPIVGLAHLDSFRCRRTGNPKIPVIYRDREGYEHELQAHQVLMFSHLPDSRETFYGTGHCPASLAYRQIRLMTALDYFFDAKLTGQGFTDLDLIQGLSQQALDDIVAHGLASQEQRAADSGLLVQQIKGHLVAGVMTSTVNLNHVNIPLMTIPQGFDRKDEMQRSAYNYANALGLDSQDLLPLSGQALGTGAQSQVLDDKKRGRATEAFAMAFQHLIHWRVIPQTAEYFFVEDDFRDRERDAAIKTAYATFLKTLREAIPSLTDDQIAALAADLDTLPREMVPAATQVSDGLASDEKQEVIDVEAQQAQQATQSEADVSAVQVTKGRDDSVSNSTLSDVAQSGQTLRDAGTSVKADDDLDSVIDSELADALEWARQVST